MKKYAVISMVAGSLLTLATNNVIAAADGDLSYDKKSFVDHKAKAQQYKGTNGTNGTRGTRGTNGTRR